MTKQSKMKKGVWKAASQMAPTDPCLLVFTPLYNLLLLSVLLLANRMWQRWLWDITLGFDFKKTVASILGTLSWLLWGKPAACCELPYEEDHLLRNWCLQSTAGEHPRVNLEIDPPHNWALRTMLPWLTFWLKACEKPWARGSQLSYACIPKP